MANRDAVVGGFQEFCATASISGHRFWDEQIHVSGATAIASFAFDIVYQRAGDRDRSTGHDVWVFTRSGGAWLAVWRTMVGVREEPA